MSTTIGSLFKHEGKPSTLLPVNYEEQIIFFKRLFEKELTLFFKKENTILKCAIPSLLGNKFFNVFDIKNLVFPCKYTEEQKANLKGLHKLTTLEEYLPNKFWKNSLLPYNIEFSDEEFEKLFVKSDLGFTVKVKGVANALFVNFPDLEGTLNRVWFSVKIVKELNSDYIKKLSDFILDDDAEGNWAGEFFTITDPVYVLELGSKFQSYPNHFIDGTVFCISAKK